jgi:hypothetical protein
VLDGLLLLMEKVQNGDREPAVLPPQKLPPLVQLHAKRNA